MSQFNTLHQTNPSPFDQAFLTLAGQEAREAYLKSAGEIPTPYVKASWDKQIERSKGRSKSMVELAKKDQSRAVEYTLSAMRNWAREQAEGGYVAEKAVNKDANLATFFSTFEADLPVRLASVITEIELAWDAKEQQEQVKENQAGLDRRAQQEQIFKEDHQYVLGAYQQLNTFFDNRDQGVTRAWDAAAGMAGKVEELAGQVNQASQTALDGVAKREEAMGKLAEELVGVVNDVRKKNGFVIGETIKSAVIIGCIGLVIVMVIILAVFLASPK